MKESITRVGIDAHKKEHQVAIRYAGSEEIVQMTIANEPRALRRFVKRVLRESEGPVEMCYEAGQCGFSLKRQIEKYGAKCGVAAPSLIPVKPGERIKTNRRDAKKLVTLLEAGLLTMVAEPSEEEEAVRDLCRCRESVQKDLVRMKHRLEKFATRRAMYYLEGKQWTEKHWRWLRGLRFENEVDRTVFEQYMSQVEQHEERLKVLDQELEAVSRREPYATPVGWLKCFHGIDTVTGLSLVAELYGIERFQSARELMAYLGLVISEASSGESRSQGGITKAGNRRVRRLLVECAWQYTRGWGRDGKAVVARREGQPQWVIRIAEKAHKRLWRRYWRLVNRGKNKKVAVVAVAREFAGFIWSVLHAQVGLVEELKAAD